MVSPLLLYSIPAPMDPKEKEILDNAGGNNATPDTDENQNGKQENSPADKQPNKDELTKKRYKEQMEGSKKEAERLAKIAFNAQVKLAQQDANNLLELHKQDPKLAEQVAEKFGYSNFADAKRTITGSEDTELVPQQEDFETLYEKKRAEERHQEALEEVSLFFEKSSLESDQQDQAQEYFDRITEWRKLTRSQAIEFAEMATLYVQKDSLKQNKFENWVKQFASTKVNTKKVDTEEETPKTMEIVKDWQLVTVTLPSNKSD